MGNETWADAASGVEATGLPNDLHVQFDVDAFDAHSGMPGLHAVGRKVVAPERATVLPPDIFQRFENNAFWLNAQANIHAVRVV
jgi:sulfotransferase